MTPSFLCPFIIRLQRAIVGGLKRDLNVRTSCVYLSVQDIHVCSVGDEEDLTLSMEGSGLGVMVVTAGRMP